MGAVTTLVLHEVVVTGILVVVTGVLVVATVALTVWVAATVALTVLVAATGVAVEVTSLESPMTSPQLSLRIALL